ncbi:MAG: hypothetical protein JNM17_24140 [Archangium sp.]|nr:hypothetical protein [Archangium sp.]
MERPANSNKCAEAMVLADWQVADEDLERLERHSSLQAILVAMRKFVALAKDDPVLVETHPAVSLASIVLLRGPRRVYVAWREESGRFHVYSEAPTFEFSEATMADEGNVLRVVRETLEGLEAG